MVNVEKEKTNAHVFYSLGSEKKLNLGGFLFWVEIKKKKKQASKDKHNDNQASRSSEDDVIISLETSGVTVKYMERGHFAVTLYLAVDDTTVSY